MAASAPGCQGWLCLPRKGDACLKNLQYLSCRPSMSWLWLSYRQRTPAPCWLGEAECSMETGAPHLPEMGQQ